MTYLLYFCGVLGFERESIADLDIRKILGSKAKLHKDLFRIEPISNQKHRPFKRNFWQAVSYLHDYLLKVTKKSHWRELEEFLRTKNVWSKTSLKSKYYARKKKLEPVPISLKVPDYELIDDSDKYDPNEDPYYIYRFLGRQPGQNIVLENCKPSLENLISFYNSNKRYICHAMKYFNPRATTGMPFYWSVKLVYL